jgi:hypothetical protein
LAALAGRWEMVAGYFLWILSSRISHAAISWRQGRRFSAFYVPLQILSDWATALTKLWVVFHPAKQNWLNRGKRTLNTTQGSAFFGLRTGFAHYLYVFSCAAVLIGVGTMIGLLPVSRDARLFLRPSSSAPKRISAVQHSHPARPAMLAAASMNSTFAPVKDGAVSKMLWLRPGTAFKSESRDAENNNKRIEPLLYEQSRQQ